MGWLSILNIYVYWKALDIVFVHIYEKIFGKENAFVYKKICDE